MAKYVPDSTLDAMLDYIADNCVRVDICSAEPSTYAEASSTYSLADHTVTAGVGNGDFTRANGDTSGRKITLVQQTGITIDSTGTATHIALTDGSSELLAVTTCTSQALTATEETILNAFDIELSDVS